MRPDPPRTVSYGPEPGEEAAPGRRRRDGVGRPRAPRVLASPGGFALRPLTVGGCGGGDGRTTIRFSWWGDEERAGTTRAAVGAFEAESPTIRVKTESLDYNSYFDRLATPVAAKDEPDVITMGGAYPREYGARGVLLGLATVTELLSPHGLRRLGPRQRFLRRLAVRHHGGQHLRSGRGPGPVRPRGGPDARR
jgi:hypothetical protein